jgi:hypothetical protein
VAGTGYALGSGSTTYGSTYTMTCATGYSGTAASLTCQSSGSWTSQSGCTIVNCNSPIAGTGYALGSGSTTYGSTYTMTCATGYNGTAASLTCQASGSWTAQAGCSIVSCGTPVAATGYVLGSGTTTYGSSYSLTCASDYSGSAASISCQASGSWTAQSGCTYNYVSGTGGTVSYYRDYIIHTFTSSGTWTPSVSGNVEFLLVAGGGGAGWDAGGAGGGGGVAYSTAYPVTAGQVYTVTIGAGGASSQASYQRGASGGNSVFGSVTAYGGGGAGTWPGSCSVEGYGANGGSGGGAGLHSCNGGSATQTSGSNYVGLGNPGGSSAGAYGTGGGGGAGGRGQNGVTGAAVDGGIGYTSTISGGTAVYAGGGYGNCDSCAVYPTGFSRNNVYLGYYGFGATGTGYPNGSANGNPGIFIVRYLRRNPGNSGSGGTVTTVTTSGVTFNIHTFTTSGTFTITNSATVELLVVAGGGGAGYDAGGAGGGGGVAYSTAYPVTAGQVTVTIGAGGASSQAGYQRGASGGNSVFGSVTAYGGGGAGTWPGSCSVEGYGANGGSGGGGGFYSCNGGSATQTSGFPSSNYVGLGNPGGNSAGAYGTGGGGGAGGLGQNGVTGAAVDGGVGFTCSITGSSAVYAGGGYGNCDSCAVYGTGYSKTGVLLGNYGFGATGTGYPNGAANGNPGIVVVRYPTN